MRFKKPLLCSWICLFSICVATGCGETETTVDTSTSEITSDAQTPNDVAPHNITPDTATDVTSPVTLPENISVHTTAFDRSAQENYCLSRTSFYIDESNDLWIWGDLIVQQLTGVLLNNLSKLQNEELPQNAIAISSYTPNKSNMLDTTILYPICVAEDISIVSNGQGYKSTYLVTTDGSLWVPQSDVNPSMYQSDPNNQYVKISDSVQMTEHAFGNDIAINQDGVLWVWGTEKLLSVEQISSPIKILDAVASIDVLYFSSSNRISIYALRIYGCHQIERLVVVVE